MTPPAGRAADEAGSDSGMRTTSFNVALALDRLAVAIPPVLYGLGGCLLARKLLPVPAWLSPAFLAAAAAVCLAALVAIDAVRNVDGWFSPDYARAWLDWRNRAGGAIIAGRAGASGAGVVPAASLRHLAGKLMLPALFLAATALVPAPAGRAGVSGADMGREIARLEREVEAAWNAGALTEPDALAMLRQLQRMRDLAEQNPQSAAEAMASLPARLEEARARRMALAADALEKAVAAREAWAGAGEGDGENVEARLDELRRAMENLAREEGGGERLEPGLSGALDALAQQAGRPGSAGPEGSGSRRMDARSLEKMVEALERRAKTLAAADGNAPGGSGGAPSPARRMERARLESLSGALAGGGKESASAEGPGSGGVGRGRGDAPLAFGDRARGEERPVEYLPLPRAGGGDDGGAIIARSRHAPERPLPPEEFRAPGARSGAGSGEVRAGRGGSGFAPARERAVERYFEGLSSTDSR